MKTFEGTMDDKIRSMDARKNMVHQLIRYIKDIEKGNSRYIDKASLANPLYDIEKHTQEDYDSPIGANGRYTRFRADKDESSVEKDELVTFFKEEIKNLNKIQDPNLDDLRHFYDEFESGFYKIWNKDKQ